MRSQIISLQNVSLTLIGTSSRAYFLLGLSRRHRPGHRVLYVREFSEYPNFCLVNVVGVKNKSIEKDGTTLSVEFAIMHPTGLVMPVDSHWPITSYENLLKLRKYINVDNIKIERLWPIAQINPLSLLLFFIDKTVAM